MFSHVMVGADDIAAAKKFYDATFAAFGGNPAITDDNGRLIYMHNGGLFIVTPPINGEPACGDNGGTIGFAMTPEQADAWHSWRCQWRQGDRRPAGLARRRFWPSLSRLFA